MCCDSHCSSLYCFCSAQPLDEIITACAEREGGGWGVGVGPHQGGCRREDSYVAATAAALSLTVGGSTRSALGKLLVKTWRLSHSSCSRVRVLGGGQRSSSTRLRYDQVVFASGCSPPLWFLNFRTVLSSFPIFGFPISKQTLCKPTAGCVGKMEMIAGGVWTNPLSITYRPSQSDLVLGACSCCPEASCC